MTTPTVHHRSRRRSGRARRGAVVALALSGLLALSPVAAHAGPASLVVAAAAEEEGEAPARRPIAETPRDIFALVMLASLVGAAVIGTANARRQLRGERPSADGRFRWR